jgi:hypothetical protein
MPRATRSSKKARPIAVAGDFGLGECDRDANNAATAVWPNPKCRQHGSVTNDTALARFLITGVQEEIADFAKRSAAPSFEFVIEYFCGPADLVAWQRFARQTVRRGVDDRLFKPNSAITRSASRVETPQIYISATASMTARHERRPRSNAWG